MADTNIQFGKNSIWNTAVPTSLSEQLSYVVVEAGHFYALPEYSVSRDFHDSFLLIVTLAGTGYIRTENMEILLKKGTGVFFDCKKPHSYGSFEGNWEFLWIHVKGPGIKLYYDTLDRTHPFEIKDMESFTRNFDDILDCMVSGDTIKVLRTESLVNRLFYRIASEEFSPAEKPGTETLVRSVSEYMDENYEQNITVAEIARHFNISEYYLIRLFKRIMGMPPYNYLISRRIAAAKKLLALTDAPVSEVALRCGFSDSAGFIAGFKSRTGQTPLQYRKDFRS